MRLISLSLHNYRKFSDVEVEFPDGVTGIIGLNGVGKSSLVEAIAWALYGHDATRTKKEGIKRSQASRDADCGVNLKLEMNGDFYEVSRRLRGVNLSTEAWIEVNGKEWVRSPEKTTKEVQKLLGMDRRSFFRSFYAKQKGLSILSGITPKDRKDVIIKMLRIDAVDKAIEKIKSDKKEKSLILEMRRSQIPDKKNLQTDVGETEKKLGEMAKKKGIHSGKTDGLTSSLQTVKEELRRLDDLSDKHSNLKNRLIKVETELRNTDATLADLKRAIGFLVEDEKKFLKLKPVVEDLERLRSEETRLSILSKKFLQRQSLTAQLNRDDIRKKEIESRLSTVHVHKYGLDEVVTDLGETEELLDKIRNGIQKVTAEQSACEREVAILTETGEELENRKGEIDRLGKDARCPMCGRELGDDHGCIIAHFEEEKREIEEKILSVNAKIEKLRKRLRKGEEMKMTKEKDLEALRSRRIDCEKRGEEAAQLVIQKEELEKSLEETEALIKELGEVDYDETHHTALKKEIEEKMQVQEKLTAYRTRLDSRPELLRRKKDAERDRRSLAEELKQVQVELNVLDYSKDIHLKTRSKYENIDAELNKERGFLHSVEIELRSAEDHLKRLKLSVEEISKIEKEASKLGSAVGILTRLIDIFGDFRLQLIQRIRPRLTTLASTLFERMTEGRYQGIELSEDYELSLIEEGSVHTIDRFSGGEIDMANLSLRLAISELIMETTQNELSFIILDEIFGSQDAIRKGLIMNGLKELSRRFRQILLITHVEEIKDSLENVMEVYEDADGISTIRHE